MTAKSKQIFRSRILDPFRDPGNSCVIHGIQCRRQQKTVLEIRIIKYQFNNQHAARHGFLLDQIQSVQSRFFHARLLHTAGATGIPGCSSPAPSKVSFPSCPGCFNLETLDGMERLRQLVDVTSYPTGVWEAEKWREAAACSSRVQRLENRIPHQFDKIPCLDDLSEPTKRHACDVGQISEDLWKSTVEDKRTI
jgi:hypothetical protein